jgi:uncharacterized protein (TIGR03067 family)
MKSIAALVSAVLLVGPAATADPPRTPTGIEDLQRFQGTWLVEAWEEGGTAVDDLKKRGVFFGANVFILRRGDKILQAGSIELEPAKSPPAINLSVREGDGKDGLMIGIYSRDGDTLRICFDPQGQTRPANFKPDAKAGFTLITLKKPKPPADEAVDIVGKYRSELVEPGGKVVVTEVLVERRGDAYGVTYRLQDKVQFVGAAIRKGDQLSMGWVSAGQVGVSVYKIEAGPKLVGEYTILGGIGATAKETLTPWRKID